MATCLKHLIFLRPNLYFAINNETNLKSAERKDFELCLLFLPVQRQGVIKTAKWHFEAVEYVHMNVRSFTVDVGTKMKNLALKVKKLRRNAQVLMSASSYTLPFIFFLVYGIVYERKMYASLFDELCIGLSNTKLNIKLSKEWTEYIFNDVIQNPNTDQISIKEEKLEQGSRNNRIVGEKRKVEETETEEELQLSLADDESSSGSANGNDRKRRKKVYATDRRKVRAWQFIVLKRVYFIIYVLLNRLKIIEKGKESWKVDSCTQIQLYIAVNIMIMPRLI